MWSIVWSKVKVSIKGMDKGWWLLDFIVYMLGDMFGFKFII